MDHAAPRGDNEEQAQARLDELARATNVAFAAMNIARSKLRPTAHDFLAEMFDDMDRLSARMTLLLRDLREGGLDPEQTSDFANPLIVLVSSAELLLECRNDFEESAYEKMDEAWRACNEAAEAYRALRRLTPHNGDL